MDTMVYNARNSRDLDLADLIWNWLEHWRSIVVFLLIGCIFGAGFHFIPDSREDRESTVQVAIPTVLSAKAQEEVDNLVELHDEYEKLTEEMNDPANELKPGAKSSILKNLTSSNNTIDNRFESFTDAQKAEYLKRIGIEEKTSPAEQKSPVEEEVADEKGSLPKSILLYGFAFLAIHIAIVSCRYLFSNKMRFTDDPVRILDCPMLSSTTDWETIDKKNRIDRMIARFRYNSSPVIAYNESQKMNAGIINDIACANNTDSIAIIHGNLKRQAEELGSHLAEINGNIKIRYIGSLFNSAEASKEIQGAGAAVMLLGINDSDIRDMVNEKQNLSVRNIKLMGTIVYNMSGPERFYGT